MEISGEYGYEVKYLIVATRERVTETICVGELLLQRLKRKRTYNKLLHSVYSTYPELVLRLELASPGRMGRFYTKFTMGIQRKRAHTAYTEITTTPTIRG